MKGFHNVSGVAYTTEDANLRYTPQGTPVMNVRIALTSSYKSGEDWKDDVFFTDTVIWGDLAEKLGKVVVKGTALLIRQAAFKMDTWTTDEGEKRNKPVLKIQSAYPIKDMLATREDDNEEEPF